VKTCKHINCFFPVFGGGYCKYHQYLREDVVRKKPVKSKRRIEDEKRYNQICREIDRENLPCFFCGKPIKGRADHHHIMGRSGRRYLDKKYIVRVHRKCHNQHKYYTVDQLKQTDWWEKYLHRVQKECPEAYQQELKRIYRATE